MSKRTVKSKWKQLWRDLLKKSLPFIAVILITLGVVYYFQEVREKPTSESLPVTMAPIDNSANDFHKGVVSGLVSSEGTITSITINNISFRPFVTAIVNYPDKVDAQLLKETLKEGEIHFQLNEMGSMLTIYYDGSMRQFIDEHSRQ